MTGVRYGMVRYLLDGVNDPLVDASRPSLSAVTVSLCLLI
jgi:hypothetical protein